MYHASIIIRFCIVHCAVDTQIFEICNLLAISQRALFVFLFDKALNLKCSLYISLFIALMPIPRSSVLFNFTSMNTIKREMKERKKESIRRRKQREDLPTLWDESVE